MSITQNGNDRTYTHDEFANGKIGGLYTIEGEIQSCRVDGDRVTTGFDLQSAITDEAAQTGSLVVSFWGPPTADDIKCSDAAIAAHDGTLDPGGDNVDADGNPVFAPTFAYNDLEFRAKGQNLAITVQGANADPVLNLFDLLVTTETKIRGGKWKIAGSGHHPDDYVEFSVVDKDDVLGLFSYYGVPQGGFLELSKFAITMPVDPEHKGWEVTEEPGASTVFAGLYMRVHYMSHTTDPAATPLLHTKFTTYHKD